MSFSGDDIRTNIEFVLDMAVLKGEGTLREPIRELIKVVLDRLGVRYSIEPDGTKWRAVGKIVRSRRRLATSNHSYNTPDAAELEFLIAVSRSFPDEVASAFARA